MQIPLNLSKLHKQKGAALITALFIMALVASAAVIMSLQQSVNIRRTEQLLKTDTAYLCAKSVVFWAMGLLHENAVMSTKDAIVDHLPQPFPPLMCDKKNVQGQVIDLESKFNLNNLKEEHYVQKFETLILQLAPDMKTELAHQIALRTRDWVIPLSQENHQESVNADLFYLKEHPPYRSAHNAMVSPSELRLVLGVTAALYQQLAPFITTLPKITPININTASPEVLMTLGEISLKEAQLIVDERKKKLFKSVDDFIKHPNISRMKINIKEITTLSEFFLSSAQVQDKKQILTEYNLIKREISTENDIKKANLTIIWTSHGAY